MGSGTILSDVRWHSRPSMYVTVSYSADRPGGDRDPWVTYSISCSNRLPGGNNNQYWGSNSVGFSLSIDSTNSDPAYVLGQGYGPWTGSTSISMKAYNENTSGQSSGTVKIWCHQGTYASPTGTNNNCTAGSSGTTYFGLTRSPYYGNASFTASYPAYVSDTPPTNITGGRVYNQNGVVNGDDKPDWDFYVDWWGESAGTHTISHYNLDIYNAANLNSRVAVVENVKKFTRYNFESLLPKCKVGETYAFYVDALIDNSYWLGKVYIGSIKLYKDGIVWVKNYSNGSKVEATMAYNKYYTNGSKKKSRYILVKDISGAKRIIDMYITHYE